MNWPLWVVALRTHQTSPWGQNAQAEALGDHKTFLFGVVCYLPSKNQEQRMENDPKLLNTSKVMTLLLAISTTNLEKSSSFTSMVRSQHASRPYNTRGFPAKPDGLFMICMNFNRMRSLISIIHRAFVRSVSSMFWWPNGPLGALFSAKEPKCFATTVAWSKASHLAISIVFDCYTLFRQKKMTSQWHGS